MYILSNEQVEEVSGGNLAVVKTVLEIITIATSLIERFLKWFQVETKKEVLSCQAYDENNNAVGDSWTEDGNTWDEESDYA